MTIDPHDEQSSLVKTRKRKSIRNNGKRRSVDICHNDQKEDSRPKSEKEKDEEKDASVGDEDAVK